MTRKLITGLLAIPVLSVSSQQEFTALPNELQARPFVAAFCVCHRTSSAVAQLDTFGR